MNIMKIFSGILFILISGSKLHAQQGNGEVREGNKEYKNGKYSMAENNYRRSVEKDPKSYAGNFNLGNALYQQKKYEDAAKQYMQSAGVNSDKKDQSGSYFNMGNAFLKAEKYKESIEAYKMALRQDPKDENARYNLAYALSKLKKEEEQKNKDQKKDPKDQKKDQQQKQDQQKQDQQKKDQQKQDQQKQDQQKQDQQKQAKQQPKISKEDAERMLQALKNDEKNLQKKLIKRYDAGPATPKKDW